MNRIICMIMAFLCVSASYAQEEKKKEDKLPSYDEYINASDGNVTSSDQSVDNLSTQRGRLLSSALSKELSIIRQQYRLARDGKTFGKNNKSYYGESYSLAIKISNGMILSDCVIEPWKNDEDYRRLNTSDKYKPELFWSYQRSLDNAEYREIDLEFGTDYLHPINSKNQIYVHEEKKGDFGLTVDYTPGDKSGYMVLVSSNTNLQDSTMSVDIQQIPMKIVASEDSANVVLDISDADKVLGGLFVVPKIERGGRIQLQIVGVATPAKDGEKWELSVLTKGNAEKNSDIVPVEVDSDNSEMTPTENPKDSSTKKKKKK